MSTEIQKAEVDTEALAKVHGLSDKLISQVAQVEAIVARCNPTAVAALPPMTRAIVISKGMHDLREAMTETLVKAVFSPLAKSRLGFRTDKDTTGGYPWEIVRDCMIEGMMLGLRPVGNELNIIGGNCYITREGFERKVAEFPGLTDLHLEPGVPVMKDGGALVAFEARWKLHGKPDFLQCIQGKTEDGEVYDRRIPVRVNAGQIVDAILGKARRKMLARVYERLSGTALPDGEIIDTEGEVIDEAKAADKRAQGTDAQAQDLINKHGKAKGKGKPKGEDAQQTLDPAAQEDGSPMPGANG